MPSQPDFEAAYSKNPELRPKGAPEFLQEEKVKTGMLVRALASALKTTVEEIETMYKEGTLDVSAMVEKKIEPAKVETPQETIEKAQEVEAKFFGSTQGATYYPMSKFGVVQVKKENLRFFKTEEEAQAANYTAAA